MSGLVCLKYVLTVVVRAGDEYRVKLAVEDVLDDLDAVQDYRLELKEKAKEEST